jgi:hypothetical protein
MQANKPSTSDIEATLTKQVAELFKANYKNGPWPDETLCYPIAVMINVVRNSKQYKEVFIKENRLRRDRRAIVEATKRLINDQQIVLKAQLDGIKLPGWLEDAASLQALEVALERATPALLRPFEPLAGERDKSWWYKAAFMIAERAREALERAGHESVSSQKHGDFVIVIAAALKLATGEDFKPETVSDVLAKITG